MSGALARQPSAGPEFVSGPEADPDLLSQPGRTMRRSTCRTSALTAATISVLIEDLHAVLAVFGAWAILAGLLQFATGLRRWRSYGAQWSMILSGAQSALAGGFFIHLD